MRYHSKKQCVKLFLGLLLFLMIHQTPVNAEPSGSIGQITRVRGVVQLIRVGSAAQIVAAVGTRLYESDRLVTQEKAYTRIQLEDGSIMTLGEKGELNFKQFSYNKKKRKRTALFSLAIGKLRVFANEVLKFKRNSFMVETPTAIAGVRGTTFLVWVESNDLTRIACLESAVAVSGLNRPDDFVLLTRNISTLVEKDQVPQPPSLMTKDQAKEFIRGLDDFVPENKKPAGKVQTKGEPKKKKNDAIGFPVKETILNPDQLSPQEFSGIPEQMNTTTINPADIYTTTTTTLIQFLPDPPAPPE